MPDAILPPAAARLNGTGLFSPGALRGESRSIPAWQRVVAGLALTAGTLRVAAAFVPYKPESIALELLYAAIDLGFLFATIGFALFLRNTIGMLGAAGAVILTAGIAGIVGPDAVFAGVSTYALGLGVIALGSVLLAVRLLTIGRHRAVAAAWIGAALAGVAGTVAAIPWLNLAAGVLFGLAYVAIAFALRARSD